MKPQTLLLLLLLPTLALALRPVSHRARGSKGARDRGGGRGGEGRKVMEEGHAKVEKQRKVDGQRKVEGHTKVGAMCQDETHLSLTQRTQQAQVVFYGFVTRLYKTDGQKTYPAEFFIVNIFKGAEVIAAILDVDPGYGGVFNLRDKRINVTHFGPREECLAPLEEQRTFIIFADEKEPSSSSRDGLRGRYDHPGGAAEQWTKEKEGDVWNALGWDGWSDWSGCSASCESGTQERRRYCLNAEGCQGYNTERRRCNYFSCNGTLDLLHLQDKRYTPSNFGWRESSTRPGSWRAVKNRPLLVHTKDVYPQGFPREFSILITVRPDLGNMGMLFIMHRAYEGDVYLGLGLGTGLELLHTGPGTGGDVLPINVAPINVNLTDGHWHQLALSVLRDGYIQVYVDCRWTSRQILRRSSLTIPADTLLYVGGMPGRSYQGEMEQFTISQSPDAVDEQCKPEPIPIIDPGLQELGRPLGPVYADHHTDHLRPLDHSDDHYDYHYNYDYDYGDGDYDYNGDEYDSYGDYVYDKYDDFEAGRLPPTSPWVVDDDDNGGRQEGIGDKEETGREEEKDERRREDKEEGGVKEMAAGNGDGGAGTGEDEGAPGWGTSQHHTSQEVLAPPTLTEDMEPPHHTPDWVGGPSHATEGVPSPYHRPSTPDRPQQATDDEDLWEGSGHDSGRFVLMWSVWSGCSTSCDGGVRIRSYRCVANQPLLDACVAAGIETQEQRACNLQPCPPTTPSTPSTPPPHHSYTTPSTPPLHHSYTTPSTPPPHHSSTTPATSTPTQSRPVYPHTPPQHSTTATPPQPSTTATPPHHHSHIATTQPSRPVEMHPLYPTTVVGVAEEEEKEKGGEVVEEGGGVVEEGGGVVEEEDDDGEAYFNATHRFVPDKPFKPMKDDLPYVTNVWPQQQQSTSERGLNEVFPPSQDPRSPLAPSPSIKRTSWNHKWSYYHQYHQQHQQHRTRHHHKHNFIQSSSQQQCPGGCLNQGLCGHGGVCHCARGYHGTRCEAPECRLACVNGGICIAPDTCKCPQGYTGSHCQDVVCSRGCGVRGVCVGVERCRCGHGYTGASCTVPVCDPPCSNGGTCVSPGVCTCPEGYSGLWCTVRKCKYVPKQVAYTRTYKKVVPQRVQTQCGAWGWKSCTSVRQVYQTVTQKFYRTVYTCSPQP